MRNSVAFAVSWHGKGKDKGKGKGRSEAALK